LKILSKIIKRRNRTLKIFSSRKKRTKEIEKSRRQKSLGI
jgi:hypothetical protein